MTAMRPIAAVLVLLAASSCGPPHTQPGGGKKQAPARVEGAVPEAKLATVTLTEKAIQRLAVKTVPVERKKVERSRTLGGEVIPPPGSVIVVSAPLAGTLGMAAGKPAPLPGSPVKKGEAILTLMPLLSPESRVSFAASRAEAEGDVRKAEVELEASKVAHARAEELLREKAGSLQALDEAKARLALARAALDAARARMDALDRTIQDLESGSVAPISLQSPIDGILRKIHAGPGQRVPAGAALLEVLGTGILWIRLPVYVGDLEKIDGGSEVRVVNLAARPGDDSFPAKPISAPPSADPESATVNLFYELQAGQEGFRPGQKVGVRVPLKGEEESLVVPWSAVLHDVQGGTWVYEKTGPRTYSRRRIRVRRVVDDLAVLDGGPEPGSPVVTDGAAEIFGTEFGAGK